MEPITIKTDRPINAESAFMFGGYAVYYRLAPPNNAPHPGEDEDGNGIGYSGTQQGFVFGGAVFEPPNQSTDR